MLKNQSDLNSYILPLAEERVKREQKITLHLFVVFVLMATGAFLLLLQHLLKGVSILHNEQLKNLTIPNGLGLTVLLGSFFLLGLTLFKSKWLLQTKNALLIRAIEGGVLSALAIASFKTHLTMPASLYGLLSVVVFFALYWENNKNNQLTLEVDEQGIRFPVTARKKGLAWWEVEQVLLRFGTITINCYDNRMYQWQLGKIDFVTANFEEFCTHQIDVNREERKKYVW